jgi:hypothetical protein
MKKDRRMHIFTFYLTEVQLGLLRKEGKRLGVSIGELIRRAIDLFLRGKEK